MSTQEQGSSPNPQQLEQAAAWRTVTLRVPAETLPNLLKTIGAFVAEHEVALQIGDMPDYLSGAHVGEVSHNAAEIISNPEDYIDSSELRVFAREHGYTNAVADRTWRDLEEAFRSKLEYRKHCEKELGAVPESDSYIPIELAGGGDSQHFFTHARTDSFLPTAHWITSSKRRHLTGQRQEIFLKFVNERFEPETPFELPQKPNYNVEDFPKPEDFKLDTANSYLSQADTETEGTLPLVRVTDVIHFAQNELGLKGSARENPLRKSFESMLAFALAGPREDGSKYYHWFTVHQAEELTRADQLSKGLLQASGATAREGNWRSEKEIWGLTPETLVAIFNKVVEGQILLDSYGAMTGHVFSRYINHLHKSDEA